MLKTVVQGLCFGLSMLFGLSACAQEAKTLEELTKSLYKNTVPLLKAAELQVQLQAKQNWVLLDAREPEEYAVSHLPGALCLGYDKVDWKVLEGIDPQARIIVYCSVGYRSERIGEQLLAKGYKRVYNLYGGIFDWANQGYPLYQGDKTVQKVHPYNRSWGRWLDKSKHQYRP